MAGWTLVVVVLLILCLIVVAVATLVFGEGLTQPDLPLPEDKARFLRYLSCSYAMCAKGCDNAEVINIWLDGEKGGCNDVCNDLKDSGSCNGENGYLCGSDCYLEFVFGRDTILYSNKPKTTGSWRRTIETDVMRIKNWHDTILDDDDCFGEYEGEVTLDGNNYKVGCKYGWALLFGNWINGLCEGMLRVGSGCESEDVYDGGYGKSTGHIWIDPNIVDQCDSFETTGYLGNCTFDEGQKIYIWTHTDQYWHTGQYCPEVIICSTI